MNLNEKQKEAVEIMDGPLLIIAGAGSGKTKALTHRIARLIERGVSPANILGLTFTNKAAKEMASRVFSLLRRDFGGALARTAEELRPGGGLKIGQYGENAIFLGTFHSFCVKILRQEAEKIGHKKNFVIYDDDDQTALVKRIMKEMAIDEKRFSPAVFLGTISRAKSELAGPADFESEAETHFQKIAAKIYFIYQESLFAANAFDFDDLIMKTVEIFRKFPDVLEKYQDIYRYILVDEYQDTNQAQYVLINLLAKKYRNICAVGDDWQCIYSWRNADFRNILNFEKDYPESRVIKLEQNYRSTKNILDGAAAVIAENRFRTEKELWTESGGGPKLKICSLPDEKAEGNFIAREIKRLAEEENLRFSDFAVLYRTNAQSRSVEESLLKADLPYKIIGGVKFYSRKEVKDLLAYARFVLNPFDLESLRRIFNVPARGFGDFLPKTADYLREAEKHSSRKLEAAKKFAGLIADLREAAEETPAGEFMKFLVKKTGYGDWLDDGSVEGEARLENAKELASVARSFGSLEEFLESAALASEADKIDFKNDAVNLMTMHLAKGLEFPAVFIAGMEEGLFPHSRILAEGSAAGMEEERRLCYVGMTRAKKHLYLIFANKRLIFGSSRRNIPSRFLANIPEDLAEVVVEDNGYIDW